MKNGELGKVKEFLTDTPPGSITDDVALTKLEYLLAGSWHELDGDAKLVTQPNRLINRTDSMEWKPPLLTFKIRGQGSFALGAKGGRSKKWVVDMDRATVTRTEGVPRQAQRSDAPFDARAEALEVVELAGKGIGDRRLVWNTYRSAVTVNLTECVKASHKQTRMLRLNKLREELCTAMAAAGWHFIANGNIITFSKP